jgi:hypothetical protein
MYKKKKNPSKDPWEEKKGVQPFWPVLLPKINPPNSLVSLT